MRRPPRRVRILAAALVGSLVGAGVVRAGHEFPFYPSYYPQEITVSVVSPADAASKLGAGSLHAYVGADPFDPRGGPATPASVTRVESLGAYVLVTLNAAAPFFTDPARRCRAARAVVDTLEWGPGARRHAYPVTPYHPDYLQHADLAEAAAANAPDRWDGPPLRIRTGDSAAQALVPTARRAGSGPWDAAVETREVAALWTEAAMGPNGGAGPPWLKAGWSHAYLVLRDAIVDGAARRRVDVLHERLTAGRVDSSVERLNLERRLVSVLGSSCERVVAGYTLRAEPLNVDYSGGVENVAHDAQAGLDSAIFSRTVKLKDFPWNGWLTVGVPARPRAAWNPVAGFTDPAGRVVWSALADPGFFPSPHGSGWIPNRLTVAATESGNPTIVVPEDAQAPIPGGAWRKVGPGRQASARILYRVLGSRFHDGTTLEVADLYYALGLPWRAQEPAVVRATARLRERLGALRVLRVETDVLAFGEEKLTYEVPIVEVYVAGAGGDAHEAALAAPPWTTVPWHLLALAEEAVGRGLATFSRDAAESRGRPWLDLARDRALAPRLRAVLDDFTQRAHVPAALAGVVTPAQAQARWQALRAFHDAAGHFLVTNGPYRLASWSEDATVLQVFRDLSYPRGVGVFNSHAIPLRAFVTSTEARGDTLVLRGDVERVERFGREHRILREAFVKRVVEQDRRSLPVGHYVAVGPDGDVAAAGTLPAADPGEFSIDLRALSRPGRYLLLLALTVDDNRTGLPVKTVPWTR